MGSSELALELLLLLEELLLLVGACGVVSGVAWDGGIAGRISGSWGRLLRSGLSVLLSV